MRHIYIIYYYYYNDVEKNKKIKNARLKKRRDKKAGHFIMLKYINI